VLAHQRAFRGKRWSVDSGAEAEQKQGSLKQDTTREQELVTEKQKAGAGKRRSGQGKAKRNPAKARPAGEKRPSKPEHAASSTSGESGGKAVPLWVWLVPLAAAVLVWVWKSQKSDDPSAGSVSGSASAESAPAGERKAETGTEQTPKSEEPKEDPGIPAPSDVAAPPASASRTASGLASVVLQAGKGTEKPGPRDRVQVHYTGWTKDGKMFDSSVVRGEPTSFGLNQVIKGWTEGLQLMTVGEKRRFWIPSELAYGDRPGRPAGQLTFDVELLSFEKTPDPPTVPADVAKAPANAKKTKSGIAYRVLKKGTKARHPSATSQVRVHYSGWTTDGKMFDSSVARGEPTTFGLNQVIPGWTEGVQLMVEGEKTRFWIPGKLAYGDEPRQPGMPAGTLVFDVELLEILTAE